MAKKKPEAQGNGQYFESPASVVKVWQRKPPRGFLEKSNGVKVLDFQEIGTKTP
jgi:hypothetical protein